MDEYKELNLRFMYSTYSDLFETDDYSSIPFDKLYCHDDNPSFIERNKDIRWIEYGKLHRLNGPAKITKYLGKLFYLNGKLFINFEDWLEHHPNQDKTFKVMMKLKYS